MPSTAVKAVFLIGSNAVFLWPAVVAFRDSMFYESLVFFMMCVVSSLYHVLDVGYKVNLGLKYSVYKKLDFFFAFSLISRTTLMVVFNTGSSSTADEKARNLQIKQLANLFLDTIALALVLEDVETLYFVGVLSVFCVVFIIGALVFYRETLSLDVSDLIVGWVFIGLGSMCFFLCGDCPQYWIAHSVWHACVAIGIFLMVESKNKAWSLLSYIWKKLTSIAYACKRGNGNNEIVVKAV